MRGEPRIPETERGEVRLPGGCFLCGGDLEVRLAGSRAGSYCRACHWISRPYLERHSGEVHLAHLPAGWA